MRLRELAETLGREVRGDGDVLLHGVAPLEAAGPGDLTFVRSLAWGKKLSQTKASAAIVPSVVETGTLPALVSPNPGLDFARAVGLLVPGRRPAPGIHASAFVAAGASVEPSASVGPLCSVADGARIGARSVLHAGVHVYPDVVVGEDCVLHAGSVLREDTQVGDRVVLQPGVVLGGDGFGYAFDEQGRLEKVPQVGRVVVESDVEIGAGTTVDRASLGETRIRAGAKIDNLVMVAHNCDVGENAVIIAQAGIAGSTTVGRHAILMAQSGAAGHLTVGERAFVAARTGLHKDVPAGARVYGAPFMEERRWHRVMAALTRLPEALRRLRAVEKKIGIGDGPESGEPR